MRVLIAPDKFAGTLTAVQAAEAIAEGWRQTSPADDLVLAPLADGGPGFLDAVHAALGGELLVVPATDPLGREVPAAVLVVGDTAYVEAAEACGLALVAPEDRDPTVASTYGVGALVLAALESGAHRLVVGLGGSATNDGGAGMLDALGARVVDGPEDSLRRGGLALTDVVAVDLEPARERLAGVELVLASDVDSPLAGPGGASMAFAAQKGATFEQAAELDGALAHWGRITDEKRARAAGAGAAGGLGHALLLLGARRENGVEVVMRATGFADAVADVDLVVTGEGSFDATSLRGKVPAGVARAATAVGRPVIVLAGRVEVGRREMAATGVESAYACAETPDQVAAAMARPAEVLTALAARVARTWSRR
ncbi:MAG: glycerate kinase family protein [Motilibacteraceae bacterium]